MALTSWKELVGSNRVGKGGSGIWDQINGHHELGSAGMTRRTHLFTRDALLELRTNRLGTGDSVVRDLTLFSSLGVPFDLDTLEQSEAEQSPGRGVGGGDGE